MTQPNPPTFEEARAQFDEDLAQLHNGADAWSDIERATLFFLRCRERYNNGENRVVLEVINSASVLNIPIPPWAMEAFSKIYDTVLGPEAVHRSWDEAFGKPIPKGKHLSWVHNQQKSFQIFSVIQWLRDNGESVGEAMFESVGNHFGIDKTTCSDLYHTEKKMWDETMESIPNGSLSANF